MSVIFILIIASLLVSTVFLGGFLWAARSGQYEDTCTPSMRILSDDEEPTGTLPRRNLKPEMKNK